MYTNAIAKALFEAIENHDENLSLELIAIIEKYPQFDFTHFTTQNKTFLVRALESKLEKTASRLFEIMHNTHSLIFKIDNQGRTLVWYAVFAHHHEILLDCIRLSQTVPDKGHFWLQSDVWGNTLLHCAALVSNKKAAELILGNIDNKKDALAFINRTNMDGKTALHQARTPEMVEFLLDNGAGNVSANDQAKAFSSFLKLEIGEQVKIFSRLDKSLQKQYLDYFKTKLKEKENPKFEEAYIRCAELHSLKAQMIAKGLYHKEIQKVCQKNIGKLPEELANELKNHDAEVENNIILTHTDQTWSVIDNDRLVLSNLIKEITISLGDLQKRPIVPIKHKIIGNILIGAEWLLYAGLITFLGVKVDYYNKRTSSRDDVNWTSDDEKSFDYTMGLIVSIVVGCCANVFLNYLTISYFFNLQEPIAKTEWENIIKNLKDIISKIETYPQDGKNELLKSVDITLFKTSIESLDKNSVGIKDLIDILDSLKDLLTSLRGNLNKSNNPMKLFYAPTKENELQIEILDNNNETENLIQREPGTSTKNWRCNII